jgi:DNA-binding transcriptional MerR regulator
MRISQLSAESGVPIPTIKYYLREGLLPTGAATARTRAEYGEGHLRRLRLIRALLEVGRLPLSAIREVIAAVEDESLPVHDMLGTAHYALARRPEPGDDDDWRAAQEQVDLLIAELGWQVYGHAPARDELAQLLVTMRHLDLPATAESLRPYAAIAQRLVTELDLPTIPFDGPRDLAVESLVLGTVLYGRAFDVLRRLAQESESARLLGVPPEPAYRESAP